MKHASTPAWRAVAACALLGAALSSCSDDSDAGETGESATISGIFQDEAGAPIPNALVHVFLHDSAFEERIDARALRTNDAGRFQTTFSFDVPTFPVFVSIHAWPEIGTGMTDFQDGDSLLRLEPGSSSAALHYQLTSYAVEPSVIGIPAAPLTRDALVGRYDGATVRPYDPFVSQVYLEITFSTGTGSELGDFDFDYMATRLGGRGDVFGAVHNDTLFMQLSEVEPFSRVTHYRVIATSPAADTLVAWPEPCEENCISKDAPVRLVRRP